MFGVSRARASLVMITGKSTAETRRHGGKQREEPPRSRLCIYSSYQRIYSKNHSCLSPRLRASVVLGAALPRCVPSCSLWSKFADSSKQNPVPKIRTGLQGLRANNYFLAAFFAAVLVFAVGGAGVVPLGLVQGVTCMVFPFTGAPATRAARNQEKSVLVLQA